MSDVKLHHAHSLGLDKARELARHWADEGAKKLGLTCRHEEGDTQDVITFERSGVSGRMTVSGTDFDLHVKLGMMMKPFKPMIESEIARNLDRIVERAGGKV